VDGVEHGGDGLGLALGTQHRGLPIGLGPQHGGLPLALGAQDAGLPVTGRRQDLRLPLALGQQDLGPLLALGAGALLHGVADGGRRLDRAQLDAVDLDAPLAGGLVEDACGASG
jgi:hypothetical protein